MKLSILMATYNGEKYICQQMDSILSQSRQPDEVIICDDKSSDNTVKIINHYIQEKGLKNWKIVCSKQNKGFANNFATGMKYISGDIVFFCDQDDIWNKEKLLMFEKVFTKCNAEAVVCMQQYIDSHNNYVTHILDKKGIADYIYKIKRHLFDRVSKVSFCEQVKSNYSTGMALAARKDFVMKCMENRRKYNVSHDLIIGMSAAASGRMYRINIPLVKRRIHDSNTSKPMTDINARMKNAELHIMGIENKVKLLKLCDESLDITLAEEKELSKVINHLQKSIDALRAKNIKLLWKLVVDFSPMISKRVDLYNFIYVILLKFRANSNEELK